jgi:hypothetical protein
MPTTATRISSFAPRTRENGLAKARPAPAAIERFIKSRRVKTFMSNLLPSKDLMILQKPLIIPNFVNEENNKMIKKQQVQIEKS